MIPAWRLLLVSEQSPLFASLVSELEPAGYQLAQADDLATAWLVLMGEPPPELVLLDASLEEEAAIALVRRMRLAAITLPAMLLMRVDSPDQRAEALEAGVDDCLTLPYWPRELRARLQAMLRRRWPSAEERIPDQQLAWGGLRLNRTRREVWCDARLMPFSFTEVRLLEVLMLQPTVVHSADALRLAIWGEAHQRDPDLLEVYAEALLHKLHAGLAAPLIEASWVAATAGGAQLGSLRLISD